MSVKNQRRRSAGDDAYAALPKEDVDAPAVHLQMLKR
jgi:hypothetical protein